MNRNIVGHNMDSMLSNATELWEDFWERRDKRMDDYPLMNNPLHTAIICCIYVFLVTFAGPRYMQDRKPMNLKSFLVVYNAAMVILSTYMFIQVRHKQTSCKIKKWLVIFNMYS